MNAKTLLLLSLVPAGAAHAAGFAVDTHGGRPTGMATAVAALSDDPSAAFYNPAGLLGGEGLELAVGDTLILPSIQVTGPSGESTTGSGLSPPPHLYARYQVMERVAAGLGVFVPFGANTDWPDGWEGRFRTTGSNLQVFVINPEAAFQLHERVRVGAGLQITRATVLLTRDLDFLDSQGSVELGGGTWAAGFNLGVQVQLLPELLDLGVSWRSAVQLNVDGRAHFENVPVEFQSRLKDQAVSTSVELPDVVYAGLGFHPLEALRLGFDVHYFRWSSFPSLDLNFEDPDVSSSLEKNWRDTFSFHLGGEYDLTDQLSVRAGVAYDPTPSPADTLTPDLPDSDRFKVAVGAGYALGDLQFDLAYQLVLLNQLDSTSPLFPARYNGTAHVVGLTVGWRAPF